MVLLSLPVPRWVRDENEKVIKKGAKKIPKKRVRAEDLKDNSMKICRSIGAGSMCDAAKEQVGGSKMVVVLAWGKLVIGACMPLCQLPC